MSRACPACHKGDEVVPDRARGMDGLWLFTCNHAREHEPTGPHEWLDTNPAMDSIGTSRRSLDDIAAALGPCFERGEPWLEYAVVEWRFRQRAPKLFDELVQDVGHIVFKPRSTQGWTASAYIVQALGLLRDRDALQRRFSAATGPWAEQQRQVSYWARSSSSPIGEMTWDQYAREHGLDSLTLLRTD